MGDHDHYTDAHIRAVLKSVKTVAIIGASANTVRPSFFVAQYMAAKGYELYPINPGQAGKPIAGAMTYATLADVPVAVDMVDIFRKPEALPGIVREIIALETLPKVVWLQLGIRDDAIAAALEMAGITVIQNRCPKIEYARLCGEIGWTGFNRRTISSKKPKLAKGFQHYSLDGE
ncbi:CoA-binding protein [Ahrensia sp. R2A130]|uniref:CoA-binding protein n=1 Tax=Ahrensia sp. R2A130 TaxID=744979 RepID=UPI0001E08C20|nr:CoA-binding protein [Ahrensia sp. R2A130]EFL90559.1 CoA-binding domain-containing protein [Ahrensia sp. R2A130]